MKSRVSRTIIPVIILSVVLYLALAIYFDVSDVGHALSRFNLVLIPIIIMLVTVDFLLRALRWDYYLRTIGLNIPKRRSYLVFFSGFSMSITPGKSGELIKSYLLKKEFGVNYSRSAPVVLVERFTDLLGMMILAAIGLLTFRYGVVAIGVVIVLLISLLFIIQSRKWSSRIITVISRLPKVSKYRPHMEEAYERTRSLLRPPQLFVGLGLSTCAWFLECLSLYLVLNGLGIGFGLFDSVFVFSFASIVGIASMLPGGLGTTEGGMLGLLALKGISSSYGTASVLLIRLLTLWYAVVIGLFALHRTNRTRPGVSASRRRSNNGK